MLSRLGQGNSLEVTSPGSCWRNSSEPFSRLGDSFARELQGSIRLYQESSGLAIRPPLSGNAGGSVHSDRISRQTIPVW